MNLTETKKLDFIATIKDKLSQFSEINKIILFGSFIKTNNPNDIDIAIVQNSNDNFLTLSLKYRKVLRELSKNIPLDIVPIKTNAKGVFLEEINKGQIVYER
ncbi:nucleotidyltransferase domain-containing protein [Arcobacteraceae bacterium]|nr:nucleotidyltransferase domain-containing protein [Arcobacteraceae bacterium]